jgi:hypothetical protein
MTFGQSFKVITCTPGVTVGTTTIDPRMVIDQSANLITVPRGGSIWFLTDDGWLCNLTQSTRVDKLRELIVMPAMPGAVMDGAPQFYTKAVESRFNSDMIGDTLFIFWPARHLRSNTTFVFHVADMFDDPLDTLTTDRNWLLADVSEWRKKQWDFIYTVSGRKAGQDAEEPLSSVRGVRFKQKKKDVPAMNARIMNVGTYTRLFKDDEDKEFYQCVIYELNDLHCDQLFVIYKILSQKKIPKDPFMKAYFDRLNERYGLNELTFD